MDAGDVAIAVLAAGKASRFGSDKLMAQLDGVPLGILGAQRLAMLPSAGHIAVCQPSAAIAAQYASLGYAIVENPGADEGLSGSLHLAVKAASGTQAKAILVLLADMPFVDAGHVQRLIAACDGDIIASSDGKHNMPPAIFPRPTWPLLLATKGDSGARDFLANAQILIAPDGMLRDIDTPDDLVASKTRLHRIGQKT